MKDSVVIATRVIVKMLSFGWGLLRACNHHCESVVIAIKGHCEIVMIVVV